MVGVNSVQFNGFDSGISIADNDAIQTIGNIEEGSISMWFQVKFNFHGDINPFVLLWKKRFQCFPKRASLYLYG